MHLLVEVGRLEHRPDVLLPLLELLVTRPLDLDRRLTREVLLLNGMCVYIAGGAE